MPKLKITTTRNRIRYTLVEDFVDDYYVSHHKGISSAKVKKDIMNELEPHIQAIHAILEKPRLNIYDD